METWHRLGTREELLARAPFSLKVERHRVDAYPLSRYTIRPLDRGGLLLGYAGCPPDDLAVAAVRLGRALRRFG
jgi:hypothetical protein